MLYLIAFLIILIILVVILLLSKKSMKSISLVKSKIQGRVAKEVLSKDLNRDILIELVKYERFLYKNGFTRRVIIEISEHILEQRRAYYKFYYYNLLEGIHCFIMYNPYSKFRKFYYHFETRYKSSKSAISAIYEKYIPSKIPANIYFFKHPKNLTIEQLYNIHKKDRDINKESIYKKRLEIDLLLRDDIYKKNIVSKSKKVPKIKERREDSIFSKLNSIKIKKNIKLDNKEYIKANNTLLDKKIFNIKRVFDIKSLDSNTIFIVAATVVVLFVATLLYKVFLAKRVVANSNQVITILNTKDELNSFNRYIAKYKGLGENSNNSNEIDLFNDLSKVYNLIGANKNLKKRTLSDNLLFLDIYFSKSKIDRAIGLPQKKELIKSKSCPLPKDLDILLSWHNGVEKFIPNRNLLSWSKIENSIKKGNKLIYLVSGNSLNSALAFRCSKDALYRVNSVNNKLYEKEFYSIKHFISVVSQAYREGAFYENNNTLNVNLVKYYKIYRASLSNEDKNRYNKLVEYLKQRAKIYKNFGSKELRVRLIKEIKSLHEPKLDESLKLFLNDKNLEVKKEALLALKDSA